MIAVAEGEPLPIDDAVAERDDEMAEFHEIVAVGERKRPHHNSREHCLDMVNKRLTKQRKRDQEKAQEAQQKVETSL